jgi:nucleotide-binding universal stress UspA family protein
MYQTLLVPLDGSPLGERALPVARAIALAGNAPVHLVHVHAPNDSIYIEGMPVIDASLHSLNKQHEQAYLEAVARQFSAEAQLPITVAVLDDPVAAALMEYAVAHNVDLIVVTSHGHGGIERAWLGSVVDALIRHSHLPVLVVRPQDNQTRQSDTFQRIVLPLDGARLTEQIIPFATALGRPMQAVYTLLHVVNPSVRASSAFTIVPPSDADDEVEIMVQWVRAAEQYLHTVAKRLRSDGIEVDTRVAVHRQPAVAILEDARQHGSDLIALSRHGHAGLARLLLGSVADKVVRGADVSVLLYRPPPPLDPSA